MMYLLKIGFESYILPCNRGLTALMATMEKAQRVVNDQRWNKGGIETEPRRVAVSIEALPGYAYSKKSKDEVFTPEVLPPQRSLPSAAATALALRAIRRNEIEAQTRRMIEGRCS